MDNKKLILLLLVINLVKLLIFLSMEEIIKHNNFQYLTLMLLELIYQH